MGMNVCVCEYEILRRGKMKRILSRLIIRVRPPIELKVEASIKGKKLWRIMVLAVFMLIRI